MKSNLSRGYIYVLASFAYPKYFKIGFTGNYKQRLQSLNTGPVEDFYFKNIYRLNLPDIPTKKDPHYGINLLYFIEKYLHSCFDNKRIKNEWFELTEEDILWIENSVTLQFKGINYGKSYSNSYFA